MSQLSPFLRFVLTGGIAALANIVARMVLSLAIPFEFAVPLAYLVGMATAYLLMRAHVFGPSGNSTTVEVTRFAIVNLISLAQVWLVSIALAGWLLPALGVTWHVELIAHTIAVASPLLTSFYGHKLFTFRPRGGQSGR